MAVVVLGDSLAFHGPERAEPADHPDLWPNRVARLLGVEVEVFARQGWTARDAWWALTRDPRVWPLLPRAEAVLVATGGMDMLPTFLPSYLRTGLSHLPTPALRDAGRRAYLALNAPVVRLTGGPLRTLGQRQTDAYHSQVVAALRQLRPGIPIAGVVVHRWESRYYPHTGTWAGAVASARAWGAREGVPMADWAVAAEPYVPHGLNPDGMHLGWDAHAAVAAETARALRDAMG